MAAFFGTIRRGRHEFYGATVHAPFSLLVQYGSSAIISSRILMQRINFENFVVGIFKEEMMHRILCACKKELPKLGWTSYRESFMFALGYTPIKRVSTGLKCDNDFLKLMCTTREHSQNDLKNVSRKEARITSIYGSSYGFSFCVLAIFASPRIQICVRIFWREIYMPARQKMENLNKWKMSSVRIRMYIINY